MSERLYSVRYISVDDATRAVVAKRQGAMLAKVDIAHAYWNALSQSILITGGYWV